MGVVEGEIGDDRDCYYDWGYIFLGVEGVELNVVCIGGDEGESLF